MNMEGTTLPRNSPDPNAALATQKSEPIMALSDSSSLSHSVSSTLGTDVSAASSGAGSNSIEPELMTSTTERAVAYTKQQLFDATGGFSDRNKIDEGSFGVVFRGTVDNGLVVAIKVLKLERQELDDERGAGKYSGVDSFRREVMVLGKYRHPNIVALLGHCIDDDSATRPCLVYEFMDGASLKVRLQAGGDRPALQHKQRFDIASDVARGLVFLHTMTNPPIIHQDIKSDNVLLGFALGSRRQVAKLADFGTVRIAEPLAGAGTRAPTHVSTNTVVGTGPYMPPEYFQAGRVSEKTDTYAYGVVLLELLSGKPAVDPISRELLSDTMGMAIEDPTRYLRQHLDPAAGSWNVHQACKLAAVADRCLAARMQRRCKAADVVHEVDALAGRRVRRRANSEASRPWWRVALDWSSSSSADTTGSGTT